MAFSGNAESSLSSSLSSSSQADYQQKQKQAQAQPLLVLAGSFSSSAEEQKKDASSSSGDLITSACLTIQQYWRRSFRFRTTKELLNNYVEHGPWGAYLKSIR